VAPGTRAVKPLERLVLVMWTCRHDWPNTAIPRDIAVLASKGGAVWLNAGGLEVEPPSESPSWVWLSASSSFPVGARSISWLGNARDLEVLVPQARPGAAYREVRYGVCRECWQVTDEVLAAKVLAKRMREGG